VRLQKGKTPAGKTVVLVLNNNYEPIEPIQTYLRYLESIDRSPNTILSYAKNLKLYFEFLQDFGLDWKKIKLDQLAEFIHWLRNPNPGSYPIIPTEAKRTNRTINQILSTISSFDEFHGRLGDFSGVELTTNKAAYPSQYKPFLYGIANQSPVKKRLLKVKELKRLPKCLASIQVQQLIKACNTLRDKFLICLLYETGLRLGEALGLRHEDMITEGRNEILVRFRENVNGARAKSRVERLLAVNIDLMRLYSNYLIDEYPVEADCDYVFVNIKKGQIGEPMKVSRAKALFQDLSEKTGIRVSPHLLRHTHATELIKSGWDMPYVQKRLGHASIQTTVNTYVHLLDEDLREEYEKYFSKMNKDVQISNLKAAAQKKKEEALSKTESAIKQIIKEGKKINMSVVAAYANVSVSYLYKYPEIKQRIQQLRDQQVLPVRSNNSGATSASNQVIIIQLRSRIKQLEVEVKELKLINESLAGQLHEFMGYQAQVQHLQSQNIELQSKLDSIKKQPTIISSRKRSPLYPKQKKPEVSLHIKSELRALGIKLTSTLRRTINSVTEITVLNAIEALKQALETENIRSPGGWLKCAIEGGWVKNQAQISKDN
jgi:site-specific recombinase XerD